MRYLDFHCDTLYQAVLSQRDDLTSMDTMADLNKLRTGQAGGQFFAVFMPEPHDFSTHPHLVSDEHYIQTAVDVLQTTIARHPQEIALARNATELTDCIFQNKIAAFLTLEDGRAVDGNMERLEQFFSTGFRLISLTWNHENCFGYPNSTDSDAMSLGLKPFGQDAVLRMEELGMLVDVSHLSDGGFGDVAELLHSPFVASHSNCRSLCHHPRNLSDEMIRTLADHGGVAGLNFCPDFLTPHRQSTISAMLAHLHHMIQVGGIGCVALGTDFDGIRGSLEISGAHQMHLLFEAMERNGFTSSQMEQIAWGNAARVIKDTLK